MKPYSHQIVGIERGKKQNLCYFWECGCGKTLVGIELARHWRSEGPTLVVCPLSIINAAWMHDIHEFAPDLKAVSLWHKPGPRKELHVNNAFEGKYDIYVCNYESVKNLHLTLDRFRFACIIVDESSKMKTYNSQITRALLSFAGFDFSRARSKGSRFRATTIPHRYCLTGTPAPTSQLQYWGQVKFVTGMNNHVLPANYWAFKNQYFFNANQDKPWCTWPEWTFSPAMEYVFNQNLAKIASRVEKTDVLELPEQIHVVREVSLSKEEEKAYHKMERAMLLEVEQGLVTASNVLGKIAKLRQITSGFAYISLGDTIGEPSQIVKSPSKLQELLDLLDEIGPRQVIIWANFRAEIKMLCETLTGKVAVLHGGIKDRDAEIEAFKSGEARYLVANPQSAAHGLTFTNCSHQVYYSLSYDYEHLKQSQDRIHRIGQTQACSYYYLLAKDTIDMEVYKSLTAKEEMTRSVMQYLKSGC